MTSSALDVNGSAPDHMRASGFVLLAGKGSDAAAKLLQAIVHLMNERDILILASGALVLDGRVP